MHAQQSAGKLALRALRLFGDGETDRAVEAYRLALDAGGYELPVGLHLMQLKGLGLADAARHVEDLALGNNADLSIAWALHRFRNPGMVAREYENLFAAGRANALMVSRYMVCLSLIGDAGRLAAIAAPEKLFRHTNLQVLGSVDRLLGRVRVALRAAEQRRFSEAEYAARDMDRVHRAHELRDPAVVELHAAIRRQVAAYLDEVSQAGHLLSTWIPADFDLRSWAVISDGTGHLVPHIHSGCWIIGVVYIEGQDSRQSGFGDAGLLRIGAAPEGDPTCPGWPELAVAPVPGKIVLMPAFYTHWVVPIRRSAARISVAFNVVEAR